jgi:hypothetical protein
VLAVSALLTSLLFGLVLSAEAHTAMSRAVYEWMTGTGSATPPHTSDDGGALIHAQSLPGDDVDNNSGSSAVPPDHHLPHVVRRVGAFMRHLHNPLLVPPATGDVAAILVSLQADGSEGARALSSVMANIRIGQPLGSKALRPLDRAVVEWMAGTLSEDEG